MCPYGYHDEYLDAVVHVGEDVLVCNLRGVVVWENDDCRRCWRGRMYRFGNWVNRLREFF